MAHAAERVALPAWVMKAIWTTIITIVLTGAVAWASQLSNSEQTHETRISVLEDHQKTRDKEIDKNLDEIKSGQARMEDKLDRALRRHQ